VIIRHSRCPGADPDRAAAANKDTRHSDSVKKVGWHLRKNAQERGTGSHPRIVWLGNFNRHHPLWDEGRNAHLFTRSNLEKAQEIIDLAANYDL